MATAPAIASAPAASKKPRKPREPMTPAKAMAVLLRILNSLPKEDAKRVAESASAFFR